MTMSYLAAAQAVAPGYAVESGYERLWKNAPDAWLFEDESGARTFLRDADAAQVLESVFPGSPAGMVAE